MYRGRCIYAVTACLVWASSTLAAQQYQLTEAAESLLARKPGLQVYHDVNTGVLRSLYGRPIYHGTNKFEAAEKFRLLEAQVLGVNPEDLRPESVIPDKRHSQPLMYDRETGTYKLTAIYYSQYLGDIPVFRSDVRMVVRNDEDYPLVMVRNHARPLGNFATDGVIGENAYETAIENAKRRFPAVAHTNDITAPRKIIWAGYDQLEAPRFAIEFLIQDLSLTLSWLIVADAKTGEIIYDENEVHDVDIHGSVEGVATEGYAADICEDHSPLPLPYAWVGVQGGNSTFADENGEFTIPNSGSGSVTVQSEVRGEWFEVFNAQGANALLTANVTPPGPVDFLHNQSDTEVVRAQVDAYIHSNIVRDRALFLNPAYPIIGTENAFQINVNQVGGICPNNAQYISSTPSTNYCLSTGGGPNMAWSVVVYHEYGHHLVQVGGSGQCQYGEGMSDTIGFLVSDESGTGFGFLGDCNNPLRDADNTCQYSAGSCTTNCGGPCHSCGRLISGSFWSTRNYLAQTYPLQYYNILGALALNSILLHNGSAITPQIAIDVLTLDDDDGNITNGTPNYAQICAGFGDHGLDCPELASIFFEYPSGLPDALQPDLPVVVNVNVEGLGGTPQPGTGELGFRFNGQGNFTIVPMTQISPNEYEATLPATSCGDTLEYFFRAISLDLEVVTDPPDPTNNPYTALAAFDLDDIVTDDFETDQGWTTIVGGNDGQWERAVPITNCDRGNPITDGDGSGQCWLTDNSSANACNSDVDDGPMTLVSPVFDLSSSTNPQVSYQRWYSNTFGGSPEADVFVIDVSDNGGANWTNLETVGPAGAEVDGGWFDVAYTISDFVSLTNNVQFRFIVDDAGAGSVVEAAIDDFNIIDVVCVPSDAPPVVNTQPTNSDVCASETALFTLNATGTGPFSYEWFKDDVSIGNDSDTLSIPNAQVGDEGSYRCEVTNAFGTTSSGSASLNVVEVSECDDANACTVDSCAAAQCINTDDTPPTDCCDPSNGDLTTISDGNACTDDVCNGDGSVSHTDNYDPGTQCCNPANGSTQAISDGNSCTDDVCNPGDGSVAHNNNYNDATECCNPSNGAIENIDDGDDCTADSCAPATGAVTRTVATPASADLGSRVISATPAACADTVALLVTSFDHACLSKYVDTDGSLTDSPVYQTPAQWADVVIRSVEIIPSSSYNLQSESVGGILSAASTISTWAWGDVDNNTAINFADVQLIVNVFQGDLSNASVEAADLEPCILNAVVNLADVQRGIQAFQLQTYEDTGCPLPCP